MLVCCFSDPHCTRSSEFAKPTEDGLNEYLQLFLKSFEFVKETVLRERPDVLAFGGDFWDSRDAIDAQALNVGFRVWEELSELPVKHKLAVVGNHDYFSITHQIHSLAFLKSLGWTVFEEPGTIRLTDGELVAGIPYRDQYDLDELSRINALKPSIAFTHADVIGGQRRAPKSDRDKKAFSDSGLPSSIFADAGIVLNAHYHHPAQVTDNWHNIGSLTSRTFHDKGSDPRGLVLYSTDDHTLRRFVNPHAKTFTDIHIEDEEDLAAVLDQDVSNSYARIYYNLELEDAVQSLKEFFAGSRLVPTVRKAVKTEATAVDLRFSLEENLSRYIDEQYDDKRLRSLALEILQQASDDYATDSSREALDFGWLEIHNYQSIGSLRINLHDQGLLFVRGINNDDSGQESNGSGKSTFPEAIYWVLTGKSLRGLKSNEVIRWGESHCRVSLELYVGDKIYTVIRTRKDPEYGTGVKLLIGGETAGARLASDTETKLEDLIGRSDDSLKHVCFMTSGLSNRFSNLTYPQRARLLEDIIDAKPYQLSKKLADDTLGTVRLELSNVQGSIEALTTQKTTCDSRITELQEQLENFDQVHKDTKDQCELDISQTRTDIEGKETEQQQLLVDVEKVQADVDTLSKKRFILDERIRSMNGDIASMRSQVAVLDSSISRLGSLQNQEVCPTCEEPVKRNYVDSKLSGFLNDKAGKDEAIKELVTQFNTVDERKTRVDEVMRQRDSVRRDLQSNHTRIGNDVANLKSSLASYELKLSRIEGDREKLDSQLIEREKELVEIQPKVIEAFDREEVLEEDERLYSILAGEVFNEKGVRNSILSQIAIPYMNAKIPEYAQFLWGGRKIELTGFRELKGGKSKNDIDIVFDDKWTYKGNSSGERRRVDLTIQFALNDLAAATGRSRIGLLVVDEALDTLDESGIYAAKEALGQKDAGTVLMISHRKYAAAICPRQLVFIKENRVTRLLEMHTSEVMEA